MPKRMVSRNRSRNLAKFKGGHVSGGLLIGAKVVKRRSSYAHPKMKRGYRRSR